MIWSKKPRIEIINGDCMEGMKSFKENEFDLAIVDPPYGISINMNMGRKKDKAKKHDDKSWDFYAPTEVYFRNLFYVASEQIIWGGNYFKLPANKHFIFWDKLTPAELSFSDGEYAWTSFNRANKKYVLRNTTGGKIHPTQKPVALYKWILKNYAKEGDKILDTHLGSGSIAIACYDMGFDLVGFEIDSDYYNSSFKRFKEHVSQLQLFR